MHHVDSLPSKNVSELDYYQRKRILKKATAPLNEYLIQNSTSIFKDMMVTVAKEYVQTMKKSGILREMRNPDNDFHFIKLKLPIKRKSVEVPYLGTVEVPKNSYDGSRNRLLDSHWYKIPEVVEVAKIMASKA